MSHNNDISEGKVMSKETKIEFLNDLDFAILDIYCRHTGVEVVIEDGRITDFICEKEENV